MAELGRARTAAREFTRQIQEYVALVVEDYLRRIDASLLAGRIAAGALPPGTMIDRGSYAGAANYRSGDLVYAGGVNYVAIAPSSGVAPPNTDYWRPLGGTTTGPELLFFGGEGLIWDGAALTWG